MIVERLQRFNKINPLCVPNDNFFVTMSDATLMMNTPPKLDKLEMPSKSPSNGILGAVLSSPITTSTTPTISRKVHQVITISSSLGENEQLRTALQYLGTFYGENTINERRNLRGVLERKTLDTHKELLKEFTKVNEVFFSTFMLLILQAIGIIG